MDDLIDRQAAIAAITDELMPSTPLSAVIRAKNRLKELPSVQPDHNADSGKKVSISCAHENDLISRQALCKYAQNQKDKSVTPNDIMRFPSAQPTLCGYNIEHLIPAVQPDHTADIGKKGRRRLHQQTMAHGVCE